MKTIEERAKEYADRHKATELACFGRSKLYGYTRVYNAEITAYERGATEQKAIDEEVRLKKCDDMTKEEYDREEAFALWYAKQGKGTPAFSDAIEWARKDAIDRACKWICAHCPAQMDEDNGLKGCEGTRDSCCPTLDSFINAMEE